MLQQYGGVLSGNDFPHIYVGSLLLWSGEDPYDRATLYEANARITGRGMNPYVYLPFTGLAMGWLLLFSYTQAFLAWFVASHLMIWLAVAASFAALRLRWSWRAAAFAVLVVAMSAPLRRSLSAGQLNAPLALAYPLFWLALSRRKDWLAGLIGALAMLYKLSPGIMLIYLLWTRRWRAAGWMVLASVFLMAITVAWSGVGAHLDFIPVLLDMGYGRSTWNQNYYCAEANQSLNSLFHHLFAVTPIGTAPLVDLGPAAANWLTRAAAALLLGVALAVSWRRQPRDSDESPDSSDPSDQALVFCLFIFVSLFLPSLCWDHYFIQLLFPILAMYQALDNRRRAVLAAVYIAGLFLVFRTVNFWSTEERGGTTIVTPDTVRLDAVSSSEFKEGFEAQIGPDVKNAILNLEKLEFIDSTGLGKLVSIKRVMSEHGRLVFCSISQGVMRALELTRLNQVFEIAEDLESAIRTLEGE